MFVHKAEVVAEGIVKGQSVGLCVDATRRDLLRSNHSATHLMHEALREVLGDHVMQKGSMVAPDRLRFDFSHTKAVDEKEIRQVEEIVNAQIRLNNKVSTRLMTPDAAIEEGALALFGEKYGDEVRVVSMGGPSEVKSRAAWSVELCGGTHVRRTGDISMFKVTDENAVASGVRRIEAVTSKGAFDWLTDKLSTLEAAANALKVPVDQLDERIEALLAERKKAEATISDLRKSSVAQGGGSKDDSVKIGKVTFEKRVLDEVPPKDLKPMAESILTGSKQTVVAIITRTEGKASLVVAVSKDATKTHNAVDLVRIGAETLGGKGGGGRPDMAQAGGPDGAAADTAMDAIAGVIKKSAKG
jgi:alanyl-tRNA synthetase